MPISPHSHKAKSRILLPNPNQPTFNYNKKYSFNLLKPINSFFSFLDSATSPSIEAETERITKRQDAGLFERKGRACEQQ